MIPSPEFSDAATSLDQDKDEVVKAHTYFQSNTHGCLSGDVLDSQGKSHKQSGIPASYRLPGGGTRNGWNTGLDQVTLGPAATRPLYCHFGMLAEDKGHGLLLRF
jgi:hypothetical protein